MDNQKLFPDSVSNLQLTRERSRTEINDFLESDEVNHKLGGIPGWKAAFGARYKSNLIAVCVLGRPVARMVDADEEISITRYASRPERPSNAGSWLIARARNWAFLEGYQRISAHAGVAGNEGTIYAAAGFELVREEKAQGDSWQSREGRSAVDDFIRRKWIYNLRD
ncbi:XF1762 family protein (plasmid) [Haladaptatus sp. SPP-AMP-3]|uniref:XF1762 family protein n=1 Tax=Haladaptatus sp. SPP-AMP-3 TaxID=3121295 RepID=UPI003C2E71E6